MGHCFTIFQNYPHSWPPAPDSEREFFVLKKGELESFGHQIWCKLGWKLCMDSDMTHETKFQLHWQVILDGFSQDHDHRHGVSSPDVMVMVTPSLSDGASA